MKFVSTNLLKIFLFTFTIGIVILSIDGLKLQCKGPFFRRRPPCTLFINIDKDKFLRRCGGLVPTFFYKRFQSLKMQTRKSLYRVTNMNTIANEALNQKLVQRICVQYRVKYRNPTFIKFVETKRRFHFGRKRLRSNSLSE